MGTAEPPRTAFAAVTRRRFLVSAWPWRSMGYLLTAAPVAGLTAGVLAWAGLPWLVLLSRGDANTGRQIFLTVALLLFGAMSLAVALPWVAIPVAGLERARLIMIDDRPLDRRPPPRGSLLKQVYATEASWRAVAYTVLLGTMVPVLLMAAGLAVLTEFVLIASPVLASESNSDVNFGPHTLHDPVQAIPFSLLGIALLPAFGYGFALLAGGFGTVARALIGSSPDKGLRAELVEITRSRARLVDTFSAERRRIERDLHDGAQQRLVSLTLQLGLARLDVEPDSPAAVTVAAAHDQAKQLMGELRELVHGIYPQVLTDLGLPAAVRDLADRSPVPVTVTTGLTDRLPAPVEVATYFMVAEALTNIAKHSGATRAEVVVHLGSQTLVVEVADDGHGGADPRLGTGLTGLADRVSAAGGRMFLSSPLGGPTLVRLELPCQPVPTRSP